MGVVAQTGKMRHQPLCGSTNVRVTRKLSHKLPTRLPLPFGEILPGCASTVMLKCKASGTMRRNLKIQFRQFAKIRILWRM